MGYGRRKGLKSAKNRLSQCAELGWDSGASGTVCGHMPACNETASELSKEACAASSTGCSMHCNKSVLVSSAEKATAVCHAHGGRICSQASLSNNTAALRAMLQHHNVSAIRVFAAGAPASCGNTGVHSVEVGVSTNGQTYVVRHILPLLHRLILTSFAVFARVDLRYSWRLNCVNCLMRANRKRNAFLPHTSLSQNALGCPSASTMQPVACCASTGVVEDPCTATRKVDISSGQTVAFSHTFTADQNARERCSWRLKCVDPATSPKLQLPVFMSKQHHEYLQVYDVQHYSELERAAYKLAQAERFFLTLDPDWPVAAKASLLDVVDGLPNRALEFTGAAAGSSLLLRTLTSDRVQQNSINGAFTANVSCVTPPANATTASAAASSVDVCQDICALGSGVAWAMPVTALSVQPSKCYIGCAGQKLRFHGNPQSSNGKVVLPFLSARIQVTRARVELDSVRVDGQKSVSNAGVIQCHECVLVATNSEFNNNYAR